jgi:catechol 2,3-dioxygenase-like lactoylglutathione lyase family enzyme
VLRDVLLQTRICPKLHDFLQGAIGVTQKSSTDTPNVPWTLNRIDHVVLWCRDLEKSLAFYEALGFELDPTTLERHRAGRLPFVKVSAGNNSIDLRPSPSWEPVERERGNMQHLNIVLDGVSDISEVIAELAQHGLKPDIGPEIQGGAWGFDIYDPDNNRIELRLSVRAQA